MLSFFGKLCRKLGTVAGSYLDVRVAINKLFERLFSGVLASHRGGPGSIPGRDMSVSGPLLWDGDDLGQVSSKYHLLLRICITGCRSCLISTAFSISRTGSPTYHANIFFDNLTKFIWEKNYTKTYKNKIISSTTHVKYEYIHAKIVRQKSTKNG